MPLPTDTHCTGQHKPPGVENWPCDTCKRTEPGDPLGQWHLTPPIQIVEGRAFCNEQIEGD